MSARANLLIMTRTVRDVQGIYETCASLRFHCRRARARDCASDRAWAGSRHQAPAAGRSPPRRPAANGCARTLRRVCAARLHRWAPGERRSAAAPARVSAGCVGHKDGRAHAAAPPSGRVRASCRGILKAARAQLPALLDLFAQHALCQVIEFFALLELRQNRGQQLIEYRNRALTGQDLGIGNDRLDELADKLTKNGLANRALALVERGGDLARELRGIDGPVLDGAGNTLRCTRVSPIELRAIYATVIHPRRSVLSARTLLTIDQRQGLAVLGKKDAAFDNILDHPAIVEEGALVIAVALGRNDIGALAEPHRLHIQDWRRLFGIGRAHVCDENQPPAIGTIEPLLRFGPGANLLLRDAAVDDDLSTGRGNPKTRKARRHEAFGELAPGVFNVGRGAAGRGSGGRGSVERGGEGR